MTISEPNSSTRYSTRMSIGDYVPYALIKNEKYTFDMQVKAGQPNILVFLHDSSDDCVRKTLALKLQFRHFVFTTRAHDIDNGRYFQSETFCALFHHPLFSLSAYVIDSNLKVIDFVDADSFGELEQGLADLNFKSNESPAPVLVIHDAIDELLAQDLITYIDRHESSGSLVDSDFKRRLHIHPEADLERRLDDKLSKSVLPEIAKVFYSEITHRETYKICRYAGANSGKFGKHRDTIAPHLHRRYAMTLVLNDDYEGGGIAFPEYTSRVLNAPKFSAIVFPGSLFHQVNEIGAGNRYVIISFFFSEVEAKAKTDAERYRFTINRDVRGLNLTVLSPTS